MIILKKFRRKFNSSHTPLPQAPEKKHDKSESQYPGLNKEHGNNMKI